MAYEGHLAKPKQDILDITFLSYFEPENSFQNKKKLISNKIFLKLSIHVNKLKTIEKCNNETLQLIPEEV